VISSNESHYFKFVKWPTEQGRELVHAGFEAIWGIEDAV